MSAARICLCIAVTSALVLTGALSLPLAAEPHRPTCLKGSTEALFTDCRTHQ